MSIDENGGIAMKLYFSPGACSMAPHIVLNEAGYSFDLEKVNLSEKKTDSGEEFTKTNPKGYVPALRLDDGQVLTEVGVILQYLADQKPDSRLAPAAGTMERYRLMEWLNFIAAELHKTLGALFNPNILPGWKEDRLALFNKRLDFLTQALDGKTYLLGDQFTVADAYLFTVLNWTHFLHVDLEKWPRIQDYLGRVATRSAVQETMKEEGLTK